MLPWLLLAGFSHTPYKPIMHKNYGKVREGRRAADLPFLNIYIDIVVKLMKITNNN